MSESSEVKAELTIQIAEGGMDTFVASGKEETVVRLLHEWQTRLDTLRKESLEMEEKLTRQGTPPQLSGPRGAIPFIRKP